MGCHGGGEPRARGAGSALAAVQAAQAGSLAPLMALAAAAVQRAGLAGLALAKGSAKLGYVAAALLAGAVEQGFCTAAAEEAGGGADGGAGAFQEAEGTVRRLRACRERPYLTLTLVAPLPLVAPWASSRRPRARCATRAPAAGGAPAAAGGTLGTPRTNASVELLVRARCCHSSDAACANVQYLHKVGGRFMNAGQHCSTACLSAAACTGSLCRPCTARRPSFCTLRLLACEA